MERVVITKGNKESISMCAQVKGHPELTWDILEKKLIDLKSKLEVTISKTNRVLEVYINGTYRTIESLLK